MYGCGGGGLKGTAGWWEWREAGKQGGGRAGRGQIQGRALPREGTPPLYSTSDPPPLPQCPLPHHNTAHPSPAPPSRQPRCASGSRGGPGGIGWDEVVPGGSSSSSSTPVAKGMLDHLASCPLLHTPSPHCLVSA
ncbi:hypothetical protein E2C01_029337 [Portunus trituberculatus]|uniref:Uncharacterized protein n=1 Tax=Portunus trituberculatus TaxID=210409 RepID=A0A5B7EMR0_PORTR|nr:hypothetical protein [Portunus trituberculatus]